MSPAELETARLIVMALGAIAPRIFDALAPDERVGIAALIERSKSVLPAAGAARTSVDKLFLERSRLTAIADSIEPRTVDGQKVTVVLDADDVAAFRTMLAASAPLRAPVGAWSAPSHEDD